MKKVSFLIYLWTSAVVQLHFATEVVVSVTRVISSSVRILLFFFLAGQQQSIILPDRKNNMSASTISQSKKKMPSRTPRPRSAPQSASVTPVIGFLDVDSFECQIWQREDPSKRGRPCVVANRSGLILAASYEAKAFGISRSLTPTVKTAQTQCKDLHVFWKPNRWGKQDQAKLRKTTAELVHHIQDFLGKSSGGDVTLEVASADEFYLDISAEVTRGMERRARKEKETKKRNPTKKGKPPGFHMPASIVWERATETKFAPFYYRLPHKPTKDNLGMLRNVKTYGYRNEERLMFGALFLNQLCGYLYEKTGLEVSGGVAKNKLLAKVGGSLNKPRKITVFFEEARYRVFKTVKIGDIPGLGGPVGEQLGQTFDIKNIGQVWKIKYAELEEKFGQEKAQQITSWATGQDVHPVLNKICKDQMKFNKPFGDIKRIERFEKVLKDLTSEITLILEEEAVRYNRKTEEVRVDYKFEETKTAKGLPQGGQVFEIKDSSEEPVPLPQRIKEYFINQEEFDPQDFQCSTLTFTLKNFTPLVSSFEEQLSSSVEDLKEPVPNTLRVKALGSSTSALPVYSHKVVGAFRITTDLKYTLKNTNTPKLVPETKLQSLVGYNLLSQFNPKTSCKKLIKDYNTYNETKHKYFSEWIRKEKPTIDDLDDIKFVSFQGRLLRALKTPLNKTYGEWQTFAMNVNNVIYLWDEITVRAKNTFNMEGGYMGELFEQLVTGREPKRGGVIDGMSKVFPVQKAEFGSHKILLLCNVDAQHEDGEFAQVQIQTEASAYRNANPSFMLERNMKVWSQAVVSGSKSVILGYKNAYNCITKIETLSVDKLSSDIEARDTCLIFVDRLLEWIKAQLPVHNTKLVKKFGWIPGNPKVICSTVPEEEVKKLVVPKFYLSKPKSS